LAFDLPIDVVLPELLAALSRCRQAVLEAPPGAGKTTRVPLAILAANLVSGRILMLEPRRLATRAAAERMAHSLGQEVGQTVGYRIKGEKRTGAHTQVEVVTEGILTRMIQSDPELPGVGMVIFDEFHERSLQADLGLALCLELREVLRPDLHLLVMSATLDTGPVSKLMGDAPIITSLGTAYDVETRWLERPWKKPQRRVPRFEVALTDLICQAVSCTSGGVLVFLPGEGEIRRVASALGPRLPQDCRLHPLYGALDFKTQRLAIAPDTDGRKIVLATSIAETSLTIEGVTVVIDGGLARRARFDPASGMSRLVTERVTKAQASQRRGRAGRTAPGICFRLWTEAEEGALAPFAPPEILNADLAPLVLETALWGSQDCTNLRFLDSPNPKAVDRAKSVLHVLGALDQAGVITKHGRQMAALPLHPRLAHMVLTGGADAAKMAAILAERDILVSDRRPMPSDIALRLDALKNPDVFEANHSLRVNRAARNVVIANQRTLIPNRNSTLSAGEMAALAYPDRIGIRRKGDASRYILSGGKGAQFAPGDPLGQSPMIVACDLDGDRQEAKIRLAATLDDAGFRAIFHTQITTREICAWSARKREVAARKQEVFGALILSDQHWKDCPKIRVAHAMIDGIRDLGFGALNFTSASKLLLSRVEWMRARQAPMPDFSELGLMNDLENWLAPYLGACRKLSDLKSVNLDSALLARLDWHQKEILEQEAPAFVQAPTGSKLAVNYAHEPPMISVRLQEMFGLTAHPTVGPNRTPLLIELLSPARKPVQTTADLPGFWQSSYKDVRKDMRGRYPKHPWPEDPQQAMPTRRVKPKKA
jgi:ATP-dependent helicase HrpB